MNTQVWEGGARSGGSRTIYVKPNTERFRFYVAVWAICSFLLIAGLIYYSLTWIALVFASVALVVEALLVVWLRHYSKTEKPIPVEVPESMIDYGGPIVR